MNAMLNPSLTLASASAACLRLDQCQKGAQLRVVNLLQQPLFGAQDERVTLRLKELGFLPGAVLKVIGFGLMGHDPLAVQVNGTKFALRRAEAAKIGVEFI
jgi:ferrous iron transport protein A